MIINADGMHIQAGTFNGTAPTTISMSVTTARAGPLTANTVYRVWSSVDCFILPGGAAVEATTASHPLTAKLPEYHSVKADNLYLAAIVSGGTGTLFLTEYDQGRR